MGRRPPQGPTEAELEILHILWRRPSSTVREVMEELNKKRPTGYTTALKLLQIMTDKGLVNRDERGHAHLYRPRQARQTMQKNLLRGLLRKAYDGAVAQLVMQALSEKRATPEELRQIRSLIDRLERKK